MLTLTNVNIHTDRRVRMTRDLRSRILHQKIARKIWRNFITVSCTKTTLRPVTLHGSWHVPDSFCAGIELCSISWKKLVPEKNWYQNDRHTCKFLVQHDSYEFLVQVSWACVAAIRLGHCASCIICDFAVSIWRRWPARTLALPDVDMFRKDARRTEKKRRRERPSSELRRTRDEKPKK